MDVTVLFLLVWRFHSFGILLTIFLNGLLSTDVLAVTFDSPVAGGENVTIAENKTAGSGIYTLQATDPSGNVPAFSIMSQSPSTPVFNIDSSDRLTVPNQGLDAETATEFNFTFRVTAGSATKDSELLTVFVTNVNDNDPVFINTPYTGAVWENDPAGTTIATVTATDPDISNHNITYSIAGSQTTFSVNGPGVISLANPSGLASLTSPTVLQVHATDGGRTGTANVGITINDDPCSAVPATCQNGGTCSSTRDTYTCTCLSGYVGDECQTVDYCNQGPCQNGGYCKNLAASYRCSCTPSYKGENCTMINKAESSTSANIHLIVGIVAIVLCVQYIGVGICKLTQDNTLERIGTSSYESTNTDEEKCNRNQGKDDVRWFYHFTAE